MSFSATISAALAALALQAGGTGSPNSGIAVQELGAIHPLEVDGGGRLPETVWSSGDASALAALLDALPGVQRGWRNRAAARLALEALLSGGAPPEGLQSRYALAEARAARALAVGRPAPVLRLLARTPQIHESQALSRLYAELAFALGETADACRTSDALLDGRDAPYWLRARAVCLAVAGNIPAAELTAELARAQAPNTGFDSVFDAFTLNRSVEDDFRPATGLQLALAALAEPQRRFTASDAAPAWLARAAARTGPPISLPRTLPEALEAAVSMQGEERSAALAALMQQDLDRVIAAEALAVRLNDAAEIGVFTEIASAYGAEVARLPITGDTLAHGRVFVLAALAADDVVSAQAWRDALVAGPPAPVAERPVAQPGQGPGGGPSSLNAPLAYQGVDAEPLGPDWTAPSAAVLESLDFAQAVAAGRIQDDAFASLLIARIENATPGRLCQAVMLTALGANDRGAVRTAMTGLARDSRSSAVSLAPGLLAASAGAIGESMLHAALALETAPDDSEACVGAAMILQRAGLEAQALRLTLELILEEAA
jgi:hypothetical protein